MNGLNWLAFLALVPALVLLGCGESPEEPGEPGGGTGNGGEQTGPDEPSGDAWFQGTFTVDGDAGEVETVGDETGFGIQVNEQLISLYISPTEGSHVSLNIHTDGEELPGSFTLGSQGTSASGTLTHMGEFYETVSGTVVFDTCPSGVGTVVTGSLRDVVFHEVMEGDAFTRRLDGDYSAVVVTETEPAIQCREEEPDPDDPDPDNPDPDDPDPDDPPPTFECTYTGEGRCVEGTGECCPWLSCIEDCEESCASDCESDDEFGVIFCQMCMEDCASGCGASQQCVLVLSYLIMCGHENCSGLEGSSRTECEIDYCCDGLMEAFD